MLDWEQLETNPYLQGNLRPVHDELDVADLEVVGVLPPALDGVYMRNGPNPQFEPMDRYHVFDGDGMVHATYLQDGKARYKNRWLTPRGLRYERQVGRAVFPGLGTPRMPDPETMRNAGPAKNRANTSVVEHAGRLFALYEGGPPIEITRDLETLKTENFGKQRMMAFTAHPRFDPVRKEMHAFAFFPMPPFLQYFAIDRHGQMLQREVIPMDGCRMVHDSALTENYAVVINGPATVDMARGMAGGETVKWEPELGARIGLLRRGEPGNAIRWFEIETGYVFHFLNAYEKDGAVIVDAARMDSVDLNFFPEGDEIVAGDPALLTRYTIYPDSNRVTEERVHDHHCEFTGVDPRRWSAEHRYGYSVHYPGGNDGQFTHAMRTDLQTGDVVKWEYGPGRTTGEVLYVPNPDSTEEEDGYLMSYVFDENTEQSELVILSARDVAAGPIATVKMPRRVPAGFHGNYFPRR